MKSHSRTDTLLQISRRVDWRFLLPEPQLRRVALWGREDSMLAKALRTFSHELSFEAAPARRPISSSYDLVVLDNPGLPELLAAAGLLSPDGALYAEVKRGWDWNGEGVRTAVRRRLLSVESCMEALRGLGFAEVAAFWHRPTFERCLQIIPLHDDRAREFVFSRHSDDWVSQIKFATGRSLLKSRWLARLFQCVSVVACRRTSPGSI